ncbi:MAG: HlyD family efflux transporter periplasmic adaptor subunit [Gemmobacter sp.]|nr:HlyD family efflux transporter periplasmic adaptor subunit [Gemmobacter sp.]
MQPWVRNLLRGGIVIIGAGMAYLLWDSLSQPGQPAGIASGNGRIEATEINIAALSGGRIAEIRAREGDFVRRGDVLVQMDVVQLNAQRRQAEATLRRAEIGVKTAQAVVKQAQAQGRAAAAVVDQAQAAVDAAAGRLARSERLSQGSIVSQQALDDDRTAERQAQAGLASAQASLAAAEAGISSAEAQVVDAGAAVEAARAAIDAVSAAVDDATLVSPRDGRVQFRIAQEGEIVGAGGRILSLVDLGDVYMTFFLPTAQAGRVQVGAEVRLVIDALPGRAIPATVSFVADVAQFTPKTVETADERERLMFRIRARIDPDLLRRYVDYVKTGLPGMAYIRIDPTVDWPESLSNLVQ